MLLKLKLLSISLVSSILLIFFLCLGSQNLSKRHSISLLVGETVKLPNGFIVGLSFTLGVLSGGITSTLTTNNNQKD
tara:strand:+ start:164 stop:394 length:231 start_codon:yes stop_codon:yes gene_type:complete